MIGIASYGVYIPYYRLKLDDIASVWGKNEQHISQALGISEKSIAGIDEDTATMGYESAAYAVEAVSISSTDIEALLVGSESHPYAVNPTSTIIGEFLGIGNNYFAVDTEFACKAATAGMIVLEGLLRSNKISYGMTIGADSAQSKPHDALEYTASSAAVSVLLTNRKEHVAVELVDSLSFSSDTPDFWRRDGMSYPSHSGRFTGEPSYFRHVVGASTKLLEKHAMKPSDFSSAVFHMPNAKFPQEAARRIGFTNDQLRDSLVVQEIGNPYSASSLLGLANVLDTEKQNHYIFMCSYGSGAGSDAFIFKTTKLLPDLQKRQRTVDSKINHKKYISYIDYLKMRGRI
jgi:hydroxymethylglutaryl-CoA synthase